jgi:hypothetical protein
MSGELGSCWSTPAAETAVTSRLPLDEFPTASQRPLGLNASEETEPAFVWKGEPATSVNAAGAAAWAAGAAARATGAAARAAGALRARHAATTVTVS